MDFSKTKIGIKIVISVLFVEFISLAGGIAMGRNITSGWVIWGLIGTIVISQYIAWLVSENVNKSVKNVLGNLSQTSDNLNSLSKTLTQDSHKLAEGSTEQAASIQETSSTLEESSSMVHQTTQNTKEADNLAKQAKIMADKGDEEMQQMLVSMNELKRSSAEISKIIKVIDEIAFQTNILSLNAAVEAARAGDAGKGFAVVAEEVRNLAQRSAQAAKDTAVIIESNIELSEKCLIGSEQVSSSLVEIRDETRKVSELLEEIYTASQEQEIGIGQINKAISQMEQVLQANAATAQSSASSADELTMYSEMLNKIMKELKYLVDGNPESKIKPTKPKKLDLDVKPAKHEKNKPSQRQKPESKTPPKSDAKSHSKMPPKDFKHNEAPENKPKKEPAPTKVNPEDIIPLGDF